MEKTLAPCLHCEAGAEQLSCKRPGRRVEDENASPVSSMRMRARTDHSVPYSRLRAARDVTRFQARPGQTEHCAGNTDTIIFLTRLPSLQDSQSTVTMRLAIHRHSELKISPDLP